VILNELPIFFVGWGNGRRSSRFPSPLVHLAREDVLVDPAATILEGLLGNFPLQIAIPASLPTHASRANGQMAARDFQGAGDGRYQQEAM
jgi:hypothetical protein